MKYVAAVVMIVLAVAATVPSAPEAVQHDPQPATELPPISTCPLIVGSGRSTSIGILSSVNGQGRVSSFSSGASGSVEFRTGATGAVTIDAAEAGAVAFSGGLVEMPTATTAAGVVTIGESDRAAESCADIPTGQAFLSGGSTASGAGFDVQLLNPYARPPRGGLPCGERSSRPRIGGCRFPKVEAPSSSCWRHPRTPRSSIRSTTTAPKGSRRVWRQERSPPEEASAWVLPTSPSKPRG